MVHYEIKKNQLPVRKRPPPSTCHKGGPFFAGGQDGNSLPTVRVVFLLKTRVIGNIMVALKNIRRIICPTRG